MHKQRSQSHKINQPTYSSPLNSPKRAQKPSIQSPINQSPFQMITTEENLYEGGNYSQNNLQSYRGMFYKHFAKEDLHRNPLAESVQGEKERELWDSQVVSRAKLDSEPKESYLAQYQVDEQDIKQQVISPANSKQEEQKPIGFKNVFTAPFIYSYQNLQNQVRNYAENTPTKQNNFQQNEYSPKQNPLPTSPPPSQSITTQLIPSYDNNMSLSHSQNEQISQVKYRFDELLKRFPDNQQNYGKGYQQLRRKPMNMFETSAPQLSIKRSISIEEQNYIKPVLQNYASQQDPINERNTTNRPTAYTEINITLPYSQNKPSYITYSNHHPQSLNYSSSIQNRSTTLQNKQKLSTQSLHQQIHQQQQVMESYKKIIYRLENDNFRLLSLVGGQLEGNNSKQQQQGQINQNDNKLSTTNQQLINSLKSRIHVLEQQKSQLSKQVTRLNSVIENMILIRSASNNSKDERKNIQTSAQSQQTSLVKISTHHHPTPPSFPLSHNTLHAQSVPVQTSFIDPITQNFNQFNYKRLYQKQIEYQQRVKQEMHQLEMIQYAYDEQFRKVLEQIIEIKKNRRYYQQMKREIKKEKSRSKSKGQNDNGRRQYQRNMKIKKSNYNQQTPDTSRVNYQISFAQKHTLPQKPYSLLPKNIPIQVNSSTQPSPMLSRIFENQIIYQLKTQNEILKANLQKITTQFIGNQSTPPHPQNHQHQHQSEHSHFASYPNFARSLMKNPVTHSAVLHEIKNPKTTKENQQFAKIKDPSYSKMTIVQKLKKRPHSISQLSILKDKNDSPNKSSLNKSRKNGSISYISSNDLNFNKINTPKQEQKRIPLSASKYKNNLISSETIKNTSQNQISEQKSSQFTQQQNHQMVVSRYNNFIKNMKKRFGINSQIIGKQIGKESLINPSIKRFDQK